MFGAAVLTDTVSLLCRGCGEDSSDPSTKNGLCTSCKERNEQISRDAANDHACGYLYSDQH